ncbi:MAG: SGNH/GDSL hydrolase family protein [Candidatus Dormibacteria bacterium]
MRPLLCSLAVATAVALTGCGGGHAQSATPSPARVTAEPPPSTPGAAFGRVQPVPEAVARLEQGAPWFLTIGDSITSGFTVDRSRAGVNSSWAVQLTRMLAAAGRPWRLYDTACPGETTASYRTGCRDQQATPLLIGRTQHDVALEAIRAHRADLRLIVVDLGSNDLIAARFRGGDPNTVGGGLRTRLDGIVTELQAAAPGVPLLLTTYYDPFENSDATTLSAVLAINAGVASLAAAHAVRLADFFGAINHLPPPYPDLCRWVDCRHLDIHPTIAGHARLAAAAYAAII